MSLQRVMEETTSSEFVDWKEYLLQEMEEKFHVLEKQDYYLAQIAAEVRRSMVKKPERIRTSSFLLKFRRQRRKKEGKKLSIKERTKRAKGFWSVVLGMGKGK